MHGLHELRLDQVLAELGLPRPVEANQYSARLEVYLAMTMQAAPFHTVRESFVTAPMDFMCTEDAVAGAFLDVLPAGARQMVWGALLPAPLPVGALSAAGRCRAERQQRRVAAEPYTVRPGFLESCEGRGK